jgi:hypothetical protein
MIYGSYEYRLIHKWVEVFRGKPKRCEKCKTIKAKAYDWANISGEYKWELGDWIRVCRKCHFEMDRPWEQRPIDVYKKMMITREKRYG